MGGQELLHSSPARPPACVVVTSAVSQPPVCLLPWDSPSPSGPAALRAWLLGRLVWPRGKQGAGSLENNQALCRGRSCSPSPRHLPSPCHQALWGPLGAGVGGGFRREHLALPRAVAGAGRAPGCGRRAGHWAASLPRQLPAPRGRPHGTGGPGCQAPGPDPLACLPSATAPPLLSWPAVHGVEGLAAPRPHLPTLVASWLGGSSCSVTHSGCFPTFPPVLVAYLTSCPLIT